MIRNRLQTEKRLIDAVHELVAEAGFDHIKINRVAQRASVNKVLIYRYFGGLDGLVRAYYDQYHPVVNVPPIDINRLRGASVEVFFQTCCDYILAEFRQLRTNPQARNVLKNDLMAYHPGVQNRVADFREIQMQQLVDELGKLIQTEYGRPFAAIITSALTMLTFMAQDKRTVYGIDLATDEGWAEIEQTVRHIYDSLAQVNKLRIGDNVLESSDVALDLQEPV